MKLFLDANVLFTAAHNPEGKSAFIIELGAEGYFSITTYSLAVVEARRNIERKFPSAAKQLTTLLAKIATTATVSNGHCPIELPEKDKPILLSAMQTRATHLITGDQRHFGKYMNRPKPIGGVIIQTPSRFLDDL
ncbi:PIN domain-containing protein [Bdellovibrionota bacterium FG-2]